MKQVYDKYISKVGGEVLSIIMREGIVGVRVCHTIPPFVNVYTSSGEMFTLDNAEDFLLWLGVTEGDLPS